jgi:hypothetical protein
MWVVSGNDIVRMLRICGRQEEALTGRPLTTLIAAMKDREHSRVTASSETVDVPSQVMSHLSHVTTVTTYLDD